MRDEIQILLPKDSRDMFSEEIRIIILNLQMSAHAQRIDLKVYNSDSTELCQVDLQGERVLLVTANRNFFALYTNKQQLHIFSSTTVELVKKGIVLEGVCMIESNQDLNQIVVLTLRGNVIVYKVLNPDFPSIDSVRVEYQTSIQHILRNAQAQKSKQMGMEMNKGHEKAQKDVCSQLIHVQSLQLHSDGKIDIFLSNNERFQHDLDLKQWKQMPQIMRDGVHKKSDHNPNDVQVEPPLLQFEGSVNKDAVNQQMASQNKKGNKENLSSLIALLHQNDLKDI